MVSSIAVVVIGILSLAIGVGLGVWFARSGNELQAEKAAAAETALADYQAKVSTHFEQTAEQFEQIGQQYRQLYGHFANSAQELLGDDAKLQSVFPPLLTTNTSTASEAVGSADATAAPTTQADDDIADDIAVEAMTETTESTATDEAITADDADEPAPESADDTLVAEESTADETSEAPTERDDDTVTVTEDDDSAVRLADAAANEAIVVSDDESGDSDSADVVAIDDPSTRLNGAARSADSRPG
ncbi:MAG: DUF1043 family protein [Pseudomonadota bacterium]